MAYIDMDDKRIDCFLKPAFKMPMYKVEAICDAIEGLGVKVKVSKQCADTPFIVIRQEMDMKTRLLIENGIKPLFQSEPFFIVIEQEDGTTYIQQI